MRTPFPCLWFDGKAEEAAEFYTSLLPDSSVDKVWDSPADTPSGPAGMVLTVDFTLNGQQFQGLNGGPDFSFTGAGFFLFGGGGQAAGGRRPLRRLWLRRDQPDAPALHGERSGGQGVHQQTGRGAGAAGLARREPRADRVSRERLGADGSSASQDALPHPVR